MQCRHPDGMTKGPLSRSLIRLLVIFSIISFFPSEESLGIVTPPITKCNIRIDDPHISKYFLRTEGIIAVKVNARSKCDKTMRELKLKVEIYKVGLLRDYKKGESELSVKGLIFPNRVVENNKTYVQCINLKPSKYYGVAYASAVIEGQPRRTLKVTSAKIVTLNCGS